MLAVMHEPLVDWLLSPACRELGRRALIAELIARLQAAGVGFERFSVSFRTRHPEVWLENFSWTAEGGLVGHLRDNAVTRQPMFLASPVAELYAGASERRVRLPTEAARYPVTRELAAAGFTDYISLALPAAQRSFVSLATRAPGGFREDVLRSMRLLVPALSLRIELASERWATASLLRTYLGANAARHVLDGQFRLGQGRPIEAAIWSCDLRGFTALVDTVEIDEVLSTLNEYFECVTGPIANHGGEVLKFIGDAVLAIFTGADEAEHGRCAAALAAAQEAFAALDALSERRVERGLRPLAFGLALHHGVVTYGNIGARDRLDFTVIGPAVNEVTRVESLCKSTGYRLLLTSAFVEACDGSARARLRGVGRHALRGVAEPVQLYTLAPDDD